MGKSSDKKRKRDGEANGDTSVHPAKKIVVEQDATVTISNGAPVEKSKSDSKSGQSRQVRSERKKKKRDTDAKSNSRRKREEAILDVPVEDKLATGDDYVPLSDVVRPPPKAIPAPVSFPAREGKPKKSSPRSMRKAAKLDKINNALVEEGLVVPTTGTNSVVGKNGPTTSTARFICFVGNLPYSATTEEITEHFSKLAPKGVRHSTDKATGQSKGFAFLEFDSYDRMETCLKSYHHSIFDPVATKRNGGEVKQAVGVHRKMRGRKLNVELTAGGGGNTVDRKTKIREKNIKLKEERMKRKEDEKLEMQTKLKKRREQSEQMKKARGRPQTGANDTEVAGIGLPDVENRGDVHPSRLNRVPIV